MTMTAFVTTEVRNAGLIARAVSTFTGWKARRAAYVSVFNELNALSDTELNDIGIARDMIGDIATEAANRA